MKGFRKAVFGQKKEGEAPVSLTANTFIGGAASGTPDKPALAAQLNILESDITFFQIVGDTVEAYIDTTYVIGENNTPFTNNIGLKFYDDLEGKCLALKGSTSGKFAIIAGSHVSRMYFPEVTEIAVPSVNWTFDGLRNLRLLYVPKCTKWGPDQGVNAIWRNIGSWPEIYAPASLSGGIEGDLNDIISKGGTVTFVQNDTKPSAITNAGVAQKYATAVRISFTPPASSNPIKYYEVWINGRLNSERFVDPTKVWATNLIPSTGYTKVTVIAVDVYYNRSSFSNEISFTTEATEAFPMRGLKAFFNLDSITSNVIKDAFRGNNGTNIGPVLTTGKIGNALSFDGVDDKFEVENKLEIFKKATINLWIKLPAHTPPNSAKSGVLKINSVDYSTHYPFINNILYVGFFTSIRKQIGSGIVTDRTQWHMVTVTADEVANEWKFYQNAQLVYTSTVGTIQMLKTLLFGRSEAAAIHFPGAFDTIPIYDEVLTLSEIQNLYNNGNGITL